MCGILGGINCAVNQELLDQIAHRGPDSGHIFSTQLEGNVVSLAHRRLAILDLSENANQPMLTDDGQCAIIFNGEIYNHLDLRKELTEVNFKTHSDTETILYYLKKYGIEGVSKLNGVFAFAFLELNHKKLYLARDPYGVKPLYFHIESNKLLFSSEIRPIKSSIQTSLNKEVLPQLLKLRYNPSPDTLYSEIQKLRPGHVLSYDLKQNQEEIKPFYKVYPAKRELSLNQAIQQYGDLFEKAIQRQMLSDVEVGVLLSGGIDSALVAYFANQNSPKPIRSFTVGFQDQDEANELNDARESAQILGTLHHEIVMDQTDFDKTWDKVVEIVEEPLGTTSIIPMYFLSREVSKHLKVVLTGQGADEPLGGYKRYQAEIYRKKLPAFIFNLAKPIAPLIKNESLRRFILSAGEQDVVKRFEKTYSLFTDREIKRLVGLNDHSSYQKINYYYQSLNVQNQSSLDAMMAVDMKLNLADDLLLYTDKITMHFGLEARVPILDLELVEFIESLPTKFKIKGGTGKFIHKEFAKTVLPDKIVNRPKKGFLSPTQRWFNKNSVQLIQMIAEDKDSGFLELFNLKEIEKILKMHKAGINQEKQLFLIISIYYWMKPIKL